MNFVPDNRSTFFPLVSAHIRRTRMCEGQNARYFAYISMSVDMSEWRDIVKNNFSWRRDGSVLLFSVDCCWNAVNQRSNLILLVYRFTVSLFRVSQAKHSFSSIHPPGGFTIPNLGFLRVNITFVSPQLSLPCLLSVGFNHEVVPPKWFM